jgi:putative transposase
MTRPLRLEFPGALYHVTARGNAKAAIFRTHRDRRTWMTLLALSCERYNLVIHAYCQMSNHFHLMIETPDGNLGRAMRHLNARYSQYFNKAHRRVGHVFQGRYKAILVQRETYLLELCRYVVLNPVRGEMVELAGDWFWSSYHATIDPSLAPAWLDTQWVLSQFADTVDMAVPAYKRFVLSGVGAASPLDATKYQMVLGDEEFAKQHGDRLAPDELIDCNREQRRLSGVPLAEYMQKYPNREEAMARAYHSTQFTMAEIGLHFGVSGKTVERAVCSWERIQQEGKC